MMNISCNKRHDRLSQIRGCEGYETPFTGTVFEKTRQSSSILVPLLRSIAQGETTNRFSLGRFSAYGAGTDAYTGHSGHP
jgi:hypothetical protein